MLYILQQHLDDVLLQNQFDTPCSANERGGPDVRLQIPDTTLRLSVTTGEYSVCACNVRSTYELLSHASSYV